MKKLIIIFAAAAMAGCGIYKPYTRPEEIKTDGLYGQGVETVDTMTLGNISWQEMFTDPYLQQLIQQGLDNNTDLQSAYWRVKEAEATLKSARLAYLPSFNFAPNGGVSSLTNPWNATWTYTVPVTASWEVDIFGKLTNSKRRAKALLAQSQEYQQAVRTQVIASVANLYYTLLMLDAQYEISSETAEKWLETVNTMRAMKEAGMTNEAAVSQAEASYYRSNPRCSTWSTRSAKWKTASRRCWGKLPAASNAARSTSKFFRRIWWSAFPRRCSPTVPT